MEVLEGNLRYRLRDHPEKVKVKSVIRRVKTTREYVDNIVTQIVWSKGVNVGGEVGVVSLDEVQNLTPKLRPRNGYCNYCLTGSWASAVVVGKGEGDKLDENGNVVGREDKIDVLYKDGDREKTIPRSRFYLTDGATRNADQMDKLAEGVSSIMLKRIKHFEEHGTNLTIGSAEDSVEFNISEIARILNVRGRRNLLKKYFPLESISFHQSLCVGQLHAIKEGIMTNAISYVLNLLRAVSYFDQAHYKHNMKILNERISRFPESFSLIPCRMVKFLNGLLGIEKEKKRTRKIKFYEPNQLLGNVEGWKRPCLLFKIMFCLGDDNTLLPQDNSWLTNILRSNSKTKGVFGNVPIFDSTRINLHRIAVNALVSVWEVYMYAQARALTRTDIDTFKQVVRNSRYHMSRLHCVLRHLAEEDFEYDRSIKFHNLEHHLSDQYLALGVDPRIDEEIGESSHKEFVHIPFKVSSKRKEKEKVEMAEHIRRVQLANIIHETYKPPPQQENDEIGDIHGESFTAQSFVIDFEIDIDDFTKSSLQLYDTKNFKKLSYQEMLRNMHTDLSPKKLFKTLISELGKDELHRTYIEGIITNDFKCKLRTGTKIVGSTPFTIRANPRRIHNSDIRRELQNAYPDFTFVGRKNNKGDLPHEDGGEEGKEPDHDIFQVTAIIEIETIQKGDHRRTEFNPTFVVVKGLTRCGETVKSSFPYHQYKYDRSNNSMKMFAVGDIIPVCIIPISWKNNEDFGEEPVFEDSGARFLEIESYRLSKCKPVTYEDLQIYNDCSNFRFEDEKVINEWALERDTAHVNTIERKKSMIGSKRSIVKANVDRRSKKNKRRKKTVDTRFNEDLFDSDNEDDE
jgi:hypothetical protein